MKLLLRIQSKLAALSLCLAAAHAHGFYNPTQGRWLSRDPIGENDGPNIYNYVGNSSVNKVDPFGFWATDVHHRIVDDWLRDPIWDKFPWACCVKIPVRRLLKDGSDQIDGVCNHIEDFIAAQSPDNAYQHAMRAPGEYVYEAEAKYTQFIRDHLMQAQRLSDQARRLRCSSAPANLIYQAIQHIGYAFHAVSDNQSPSHRGFQLWQFPTPTEAVDHGRRETKEVYLPMAPEVIDNVDFELMGYLNYVLAIQIQ